MQHFHVLTGLPRSGSTLLCNLLNQRPEVFASSTSALPRALAGLSELLSTADEATSALANIPGTAEQHLRVMRAVVEEWHATDAPVVIDKSRMWSTQSPLLRAVCPDAVMIVTVRDPRDVLASIELRHRETGQYGPGGSLWDRASHQSSAEGVLGSAIGGVEDLVRRRMPGVVFCQYESLLTNPAEVLRRIATVCEWPDFDHDFDDVESTATDLDVLWRGKFPHDAAGPVKPPRDEHWSEVIHPEIGSAVIERWPFFASFFGYS